MKAAVVTFPGSNCDDDCSYALKIAEFEVTKLWHLDVPDLSPYQLVVLPGGFSYGDYLRSGAIAALSPIITAVSAYSERGGLVLGSCNGFQILCEAKLLPGALARNAGLLFRCHDVPLRVETNDSPWTCDFGPLETFSLPIAHGEGRYVILPSEAEKMREKGQVLLTYCDNPNGSYDGIAGISNERKNVFGLMPHPERATDLRSQSGKKIWGSIRRFLEGRSK